MKTLPRMTALLPLLFGLPLAGEESLSVPPPAEETTERQQEALFSEAELEQLLAPIALYPDVLLAQILIASTYPLEVVRAQRWLRERPDLEGEAAAEAAVDEGWDPSVASLTAFPSVLERMDADLDWTQRLGDAFLLQEGDVMEAVQSLRLQAAAAGHLESNEQLAVQREGRTIIVEPADPQVIYVPYYSTRMVYAGWRWHHYPPVYWGPPRGYGYASVGFAWGRGIRFSSDFFCSTFHWPRRHVVVIQRPAPSYSGPRYRPMPHLPDYPRWRHDPWHRRGVAYRGDALVRHNQRVRTSFGRPPVAPGIRPDTRPPPPGRPGVVERGGEDRRAELERLFTSARAEHPRDWPRDPGAIQSRLRAEQQRIIERQRMQGRPPSAPGTRPSVALRPADPRLARPAPTVRPSVGSIPDRPEVTRRSPPPNSAVRPTTPLRPQYAPPPRPSYGGQRPSAPPPPAPRPTRGPTAGTPERR